MAEASGAGVGEAIASIGVSLERRGEAQREKIIASAKEQVSIADNAWHRQFDADMSREPGALIGVDYETFMQDFEEKRDANREVLRSQFDPRYDKVLSEWLTKADEARKQIVFEQFSAIQDRNQRYLDYQNTVQMSGSGQSSDAVDKMASLRPSMDADEYDVFRGDVWVASLLPMLTAGEDQKQAAEQAIAGNMGPYQAIRGLSDEQMKEMGPMSSRNVKAIRTERKRLAQEEKDDLRQLQETSTVEMGAMLVSGSMRWSHIDARWPVDGVSQAAAAQNKDNREQWHKWYKSSGKDDPETSYATKLKALDVVLGYWSR